MTSYAHPIEGTKEWCHMPAEKPVEKAPEPTQPAPSELAKAESPAGQAEPPPEPKEKAVVAMNAQQRNAIGLLHKGKGLTDSFQANFIRERYKLGKDGKMTFNQARDYINYLFTLSDVEQELK